MRLVGIAVRMSGNRGYLGVWKRSKGIGSCIVLEMLDINV